MATYGMGSLAYILTIDGCHDMEEPPIIIHDISACDHTLCIVVWLLMMDVPRSIDCGQRYINGNGNGNINGNGGLWSLN